LKSCKFLGCLISSTFGSGYFPIAPGTVGALVAIVVLWFLPAFSWGTLLTASIVIYIIGVWAATQAEKVWGHDAGRINWDEVAGQMVAVIALPKSLLIYLLAFIAFRVFDIIKPMPVNKAENLPRGWGVMTDDIIAGIYANLVLQIIVRFFFPGV